MGAGGFVETTPDAATDIEEIIKVTTLYLDHPVPGQPFVDIFPILRSPKLTQAVISNLVAHIQATHDVASIAAIVCLEARGFVFAPLIAARLDLPVIPVRKKGKLPGSIVSVSYVKEYEVDVFEMKTDAFDGIKEGPVIIIDDLIAIGGSASAAKQLIAKLGRSVAECVFVFDCPDLYQHVENVMEDTPTYAMISLNGDVVSRLPNGT
ncbi:MAG: adenine phosphoribosyltransferase [Claussenomyces sp. TS43310]|nr:MAG: adenine phosphoribosyltransferase [Claussenomyces sp. TS43310]